MKRVRYQERAPERVPDKPIGGELSAPYTTATWELPPCDSCGGECIFTDGLCQPCWILYTERLA